PGGSVVERDQGAGGGAAVGERLEDQRRFEAAETDSAAFLTHIDGAEAELGAFAQRLPGKDVLLVPFGGEGRDGVRRELARHLLDLELVVGEIELRHRAAGIRVRTACKQDGAIRSCPSTAATRTEARPARPSARTPARRPPSGWARD